MIFNLLGFKFKRNIDSILIRNKRVRSFRNLDNMDDILILFTYEDWDEISSICQDLERRGKNVLPWTIEPKKKDAYSFILPEKVKVISRKEISKINGLSKVVEEFENLKYDTLIDLTSTNNQVLTYLLAGNHSEFCVGTRELNYIIYDFILLKKEDMSLTDAYGELISYLKTISA